MSAVQKDNLTAAVAIRRWQDPLPRNVNQAVIRLCVITGYAKRTMDVAELKCIRSIVFC